MIRFLNHVVGFVVMCSLLRLFARLINKKVNESDNMIRFLNHVVGFVVMCSLLQLALAGLWLSTIDIEAKLVRLFARLINKEVNEINLKIV